MEKKKATGAKGRVAKKRNNPISLALKKKKCNQSDLARWVGVSRAAVSSWKLQGYVPLSSVTKVYAVTGIPPHILNPDLPKYGK